ncbi:MAG: hypothetical protein HZB33_09430 [Nitrospirae bacterium]|nr:hypothetical protein [Nitrospirota bacterium]
MRTIISVFLCSPLLIVSLITSAGAGQYSGLWVGEATLYAVSELQKVQANLAFDLSLQGFRSSEVLIPKNSIWKYDASGASPVADWYKATFNDAAWSSGAGPLGYGSTFVTTVVNATTDVNTTYYRRAFSVTDPLLYSGITISLMRDAGASVYLNGQEIIRSNLPSSFVSFNTYALSEPLTSGKNTYVQFALPESLLFAGSNVIAVEMHRSGATDTDTSFDLELTASIDKPAVATLVPAKGEWSYNESGTDLGATWKEVSYDDSGWTTGAGKFGYGNTDVHQGIPGQDTVLNFGPYPGGQKYPAYYFRKHFNVSNKDEFTDITLYLLRDDGAVVYLNGNEILRSNMPGSGDITYTTPPLSKAGADDAWRYIPVTIPSDKLVNADNVLAVSVHQHLDELDDKSDSSPPTPTKSELPLHLILHVDTAGTVRLLKEVIIMADANENPVLLTDHALIPNYSGLSIKDGRLVGLRMSSAAFDYAGNSLDCAGGLTSIPQAVTCQIVVTADLPTNPFLHRYHKDHDSLDVNFVPIPSTSSFQEVYQIIRAISLNFSPSYPPDPRTTSVEAPPGWGQNSLGGTYAETISGLHKGQVSVNGFFKLQRISEKGALNE